jgi:hypothetical protein
MWATRKNILLITVLTVSIGSSAQIAPSGATGHHSKQHFDGVWWLAANPGERSGFVNGVADCMTWEAHKKGYSATPEQIADKISKFYEANPGSNRLSVLEAWRRVSSSEKQMPAPKGGETWTNPHWYLNGEWWVQEAQTEQIGFVEGYLWCIRTWVEGPHASYSKSDNFYWEKINAFVATHPKLGNEAVATTIARFKDAGTPPLIRP